VSNLAPNEGQRSPARNGRSGVTHAGVSSEPTLTSSTLARGKGYAGNETRRRAVRWASERSQWSQSSSTKCYESTPEHHPKHALSTVHGEWPSTHRLETNVREGEKDSTSEPSARGNARPRNARTTEPLTTYLSISKPSTHERGDERRAPTSTQTPPSQPAASGSTKTGSARLQLPEWSHRPELASGPEHDAAPADPPATRDAAPPPRTRCRPSEAAGRAWGEKALRACTRIRFHAVTGQWLSKDPAR
jgi:hypothetical protein